MIDIKKHLENNLIDHTFLSENVFEIPEIGTFLIVSDKEEILDSELDLELTDEEKQTKCDFFTFPFGSKIYYTEKQSDGSIKNFNELKNIGKAKQPHFENFPNLAIHGGFDILNGSREYKDWCKKAKFLGVQVLGLTERNTLAGILKFQMECLNNDIKPILGAQYTVINGDQFHLVKFYVINEIGWKSLLSLNKEVNVINSGHVLIDKISMYNEGLIVVIDPKYTKFKDIGFFTKNIPNDRFFWQFDSVEFENDNNDKEYLLNVKQFIDSGKIEPALICDTYYLDYDQFQTREILSTISSKGDYKSVNQYFKSLEQIVQELAILFNKEELFLEILDKSISNTIKIAEICEFTVPIGKKLLPDYLMTVEEKEKYGTKENMFLELIQDGMAVKLKNIEDQDLYLSRIEMEHEIIAENGYIDYFLILWDIVKWSRKNGILTGFGRGSAAGSLIAYLLDLTEIDPIPFGLIFERFLNKGRAKKSYPDIDTDFEALRRDEVKAYMEQKYGINHVCSIGTYTNLKIKQAFKDLCKIHGVPFATANYISSLLEIKNETWKDLFLTAKENKRVKEFIKSYPELIEQIQLILHQPKSKSIHACATIITPHDKNIYESIPVRLDKKDSGDILVSEWEGGELETAGYLKEDILGIKQLDKYRFILDLIKKTEGIDVDLYKIPLNEDRVFKLFKKGLNGDIFHFGSKGLTKYCKELQPDNINDLIAAIALFRPGTIQVGAHQNYIYRKEGAKFEYLFGLEEITKETYGVLAYQEQIMKIFQVLADYTLEQADDIRRIIGKKKKDQVQQYKENFLNKCIEKGATKEQAKHIWEEVETHAGYSFNLSHAACYAVTGYVGQWLKIFYPVQYWTAAFEFDDPNPKKSKVNEYIREILQMRDSVSISPPNINESAITFTSNVQKRELYWSLTKIRQVGEKVVEAVVSEREKNGQFFSFGEFLDRVNKSVVKKTVVVNLILSGAFDSVENITSIEKRRDLIAHYFKFRKEPVPDEYKSINKIDWELMQKQACGFGEIDYFSLVKNYTELPISNYVNGIELQSGEYNRMSVVIAGTIIFMEERTTKKDTKYCSLILESNYTEIHVTLWSETWEKYKDFIQVGQIIIFDGMCRDDTYKKCYVVQSKQTTEVYTL